MDAQAKGPVTIETPLGDAVKFHSMGGIEGLSQPFVYEIDVLSTRANLGGADWLGHSVTVHLERTDGSEDARRWNGCVTAFAYVGTDDDGSSRYRLTVRPWLWYLTQRADCRIFQNMRVPDIITKVFKDRGFSDFESVLHETYAQQEYVVQYRETDFNFVSRLMEREGIYYFFRHAGKKHTLVLTDSPHAHEPAPGAARIPYAPPDEHRDEVGEYVTVWRAEGAVETSRFAHADYDFTRPRLRLYSLRDAVEAGGPPPLEVYDYPGGFLSPSVGDAYAQLRLEQRRAGISGWAGESNARGLTVGATFDLTNHPRDDQNGRYLLTRARYRLRGHEITSSSEGDEDPFSCSFRVIHADVTFRPPASARKPVVQGPQTALVVGPVGHEIWTDNYGRVKVHFHWDREGPSDENSSCYVRVAQAWAGSGWGAQFIPRIGQEVVIDFLEGDPDRPIITGSVYNGANMPPFDLPQNQTQSGVRTRSTPGGTQVNCNEIRFEDAIGNEDLFVQAEKNQTTVVKNDQSITIGGNRTKSVAGNESIRVIGGRNAAITLDDTTSVLGLQAITVAGARTVAVAGDQSHAIAGNMNVAVAGSRSVQITGDLSTQVSGRVDATTEGLHSETFADDFVSRHTGHRVVIVGSPDAASSASTHVEGTASGYVSETLDVVSIKGITIRCGKSQISLTPDAVTISSPTISLVGQDLELKGDKVNVAGGDSITLGSTKVTLTSSGASVVLDSNATVQGAKVQLKGGGGPSGDSDTKKKTETTITLVDNDGKPLANQRILLREGGEGGQERTVVLDDTGSIVVEGDGPFDAIVADLPDAKPA